MSTEQLLKGIKYYNTAYDSNKHQINEYYKRYYKINNKKIYLDNDKLGKQVYICLLYFMRNYKIMWDNIVSLSIQISANIGEVDGRIDFIYYLVIKCKTDSNNIEGIDYFK